MTHDEQPPNDSPDSLTIGPNRYDRVDRPNEPNSTPDNVTDATSADETSETETNAPTETSDGAPNASALTPIIRWLATPVTVATTLRILKRWYQSKRSSEPPDTSQHPSQETNPGNPEPPSQREDWDIRRDPWEVQE